MAKGGNTMAEAASRRFGGRGRRRFGHRTRSLVAVAISVTVLPMLFSVITASSAGAVTYKSGLSTSLCVNPSGVTSANYNSLPPSYFTSPPTCASGYSLAIVTKDQVPPLSCGAPPRPWCAIIANTKWVSINKCGTDDNAAPCTNAVTYPPNLPPAIYEYDAVLKCAPGALLTLQGQVLDDNYAAGYLNGALLSIPQNSNAKNFIHPASFTGTTQCASTTGTVVLNFMVYDSSTPYTGIDYKIHA